MRISPRRVLGSITAPSRRTRPSKDRERPVMYTEAGCPTFRTARSCSAICPRISTSPPLARRNSACASGARDLADLGIAYEYRAVNRGDHSCAIQASLVLGELRSNDFDVGFVGHGGCMPLLNILGRQGACRRDRLRTPVFGCRQGSLGACLLQRGGQAVHLRDEDRLIELRQHLPAFDVVASLDIDGDDPAGVAVDADRHVVARGNRAREGDVRGDCGDARGHDAHQGNCSARSPGWSARMRDATPCAATPPYQLQGRARIATITGPISARAARADLGVPLDGVMRSRVCGLRCHGSVWLAAGRPGLADTRSIAA